MDTREADKKYLYRSEPSLDIEVEATEGHYVIATDGKRYLDFIMGWCVGNTGWGNTELRESIRNYRGPDYVYPHLLCKPWAELASQLASITPGELNVCFRTTGGSESVDAAIQVAMAYTGRKKFLAIEDSYHGNTIGPLSIGAIENKEKMESLLPNCLKIEKPLDEKAISKIETKLSKADVAAFIMEPVLCNVGVHIPSQEFMKELRRLCTKYGTLLVIDEVATGFGRTGKLFACEHYGIEPDILCLSKALTGGYAPMGATITTPAIAKNIRDKVNIYSTYGWHPISVQVALAHIRYILKHKMSLLSEVSKRSQQFRTRLSQMAFQDNGQMNIIGLAISVDVGKPSYAEKIRKKCQEKGLLLTSQESNIVMFPALTISEEEANEGLNILESCL